MRLGLSTNTCGLLLYFPSIYLKKIMKNVLHDTQSLARLKSHTNIISVRCITAVVIQLIKLTRSLTHVYQQNTREGNIILKFTDCK
jgi:hypothetical protein